MNWSEAPPVEEYTTRFPSGETSGRVRYSDCSSSSSFAFFIASCSSGTRNRFPLPSANFTATLLPRNVGDHDFELTSRADLALPGHYLSTVDSDRDALTVVKLLSFHERIHVYVTGGELKTDHSFSLAGRRFLTLRYEIERQPRRDPLV